MSDEDVENTWKDVVSTKTLTYFNWYRGQPDGENCAYIYPGDGEWRYYKCTNTIFFMYTKEGTALIHTTTYRYIY